MSLEKYNNPVKHLKIIKGHTQSSKNSSTYVGGNSETLPIDLFIEILKRLPAKAIALCRCVSKEWDSILSSPHFAKSFLTSSSNRPQLLFTFEFKGKWHFFSSPQLHFNENISVVAPDYHMGVSGDWYKEVCLSANGFVYLYEKQMLKGKMERVPVLCNPSTGQKIPLPKVRAKNNELRSFLGYDPIEKQFKVLCMTWRWKKPFYVYYYNVERKSVRRVEIQGIEEKVFMDPAAHHGEVFTFPNHVENLIYVHSQTIAKIVMSLEKYNNPVKHLKIIKGHTRSSKNSSTYVGGNSETLPIDLIIEILKRLPAKTIALCRCVSKEWDSLLSSPHFAKSFLTSSSTRPKLLFTFEFKGKWHFFSSPQLHFNENISVVAPDYHMGVSGDWYNEVCLSANGFVYIYEKQMLKGKMERVPVAM
ncbi:unnamed protein product [Brassica rapa subsp. trilocularis]